LSTLTKLRQSREQWKNKAVTRANNEHYLRKENKRIKKERDEYKKSFKENKKQLEEALSNNIPTLHKKVDLVYLALQLFLLAHISFRGVSRVLHILGAYLGISKTPCPQTIINWVTRLSIARIQDVNQLARHHCAGDPFSNGFICMIDTSIGLGSGKILTVLLLNAKHHEFNQNAPTLQQIHCVAVSVSDSWTGERIADLLQSIIAVIGRPSAYLKDGGTDLAKAVKILDERGQSSPAIEDISHYIANILKHEYQEHPLLALFLSSCGRVSKRLKQTVLACLAPPKVSTKARFMNLHHLVKWADQLLKHSPKGRASKGSLLSKLRNSLEQMPECKLLIKRFLRDSNALLACQKILKTKGLSEKTYQECQPFLKIIPQNSSVRIDFTQWVERQLSIASSLKLSPIGMPISSDNIESLFGVGKQHGTGEIKDANRIGLRLPALCGHLTKQDAQRVLEISVKEQQQVMESFPSLVKQRRLILPHPGMLDEINTDKEKKYLELLPWSKNQSKNIININTSNSYKNRSVPLLSAKKDIKQEQNVDKIRTVAY
jgi:hypothetical protein